MDYIIIVAGGKGMRMGADMPKQFLPLNGKPVLMHTIQRFHDYSSELRIIVVLPREQQAYWQELCHTHAFTVDHTVVDGGQTRFHSSKNGLATIPDDATGVVGIHDGVRPFVSLEVIDRCFSVARSKSFVVPVAPVNETLRFVGNDNTESCSDGTLRGGITVPRSDYRLVQTPQTFSIPLLKKAYQQPYSDIFTDDASVVEALGERVTMVEGNRENIKLTTPFDLCVAEMLVKRESGLACSV